MKPLPVLALSILGLVACASTPPKMTDAERHAFASESLPVDRARAVQLVTDFLLSEGYSVEHFDESAGLLTTGWRLEAQEAASKAITGPMEQRVQARIRARPHGDTEVEFLLFNRFPEVGEDKLNEYPARYDDLMAKFRAFLERATEPEGS